MYDVYEHILVLREAYQDKYLALIHFAPRATSLLFFSSLSCTFSLIVYDISIYMYRYIVCVCMLKCVCGRMSARGYECACIQMSFIHIMPVSIERQIQKYSQLSHL